MFFIKNTKGEWQKLNKEKMMVYDFKGVSYDITQQEVECSEIIDCNGWHELYKIIKWCPLEVNVKWPNVWISPDGLFYDGTAHENRAKEILEIIYEECDVFWTGDRLEELGWIRASANLMWDVRINSIYWDDKKVTQKQYDALWDWCKYHNKSFPNSVEIKS